MAIVASFVRMQIRNIRLNSEVKFSIEATEKAREKAEEIHKITSTDTIYTQQELKALYYQNIQIIELLKEIRNILEQ